MSFVYEEVNPHIRSQLFTRANEVRRPDADDDYEPCIAWVIITKEEPHVSLVFQRASGASFEGLFCPFGGTWEEDKTPMAMLQLKRDQYLPGIKLSHGGYIATYRVEEGPSNTKCRIRLFVATISWKDLQKLLDGFQGTRFIRPTAFDQGEIYTRAHMADWPEFGLLVYRYVLSLAPNNKDAPRST